jgi:hypothetical protein
MVRWPRLDRHIYAVQCKCDDLMFGRSKEAASQQIPCRLLLFGMSAGSLATHPWQYIARRLAQVPFHNAVIAA